MVFLYVCACQVAQSCLTLCEPMDYIACQAPPSWDFPDKNTGVVAISLSRDLLDPGIEPMSPTLAGRFFTTAPPGKPSFLSFFLSFFFFEGLKLEPDTSTTTQRGFHAVNAGGSSQGNWGRPHPMINHVSSWAHGFSSSLPAPTLSIATSNASPLMTLPRLLPHLLSSPPKHGDRGALLSRSAGCTSQRLSLHPTWLLHPPILR